MATGNAPGSIWRRLIKRQIVIPVVLFILAFGMTFLGTYNHAQRGIGTAYAASPSSVSPPPASSLAPCPAPGPWTAADANPPHGPQPGDSFCDARGFARPIVSANAPHQSYASGVKPLIQCDPGTGDCNYRTDVNTFDQYYYGLWATRDVTSVSLASTYDAFYTTMHQMVGSTNWTEIGWLYWGSSLGGSGCSNSTYLIYTYNPANSTAWACFSGYSISPGNQITTATESNGASTWSDYLYWCSPTCKWNTLSTTTLSSGQGDMSVSLEPWTNHNSSNAYLSYPSTGAHSVEVLTCSGCSWTSWGTNIANTNTSATYPYLLDVVNQYYNWYGCGPSGTYSC